MLHSQGSDAEVNSEIGVLSIGKQNNLLLKKANVSEVSEVKLRLNLNKDEKCR